MIKELTGEDIIEARKESLTFYKELIRRLQERCYNSQESVSEYIIKNLINMAYRGIDEGQVKFYLELEENISQNISKASNPQELKAILRKLIKIDDIEFKEGIVKGFLEFYNAKETNRYYSLIIDEVSHIINLQDLIEFLKLKNINAQGNLYNRYHLVCMTEVPVLEEGYSRTFKPEHKNVD